MKSSEERIRELEQRVAHLESVIKSSKLDKPVFVENKILQAVS